MDVKTVVELLNEYSEEKYDLVSFDNVQGEELLQLLSDMFARLKGEESVDVGTESAEETVVRLLNELRILRYKPPQPPDIFRRGLAKAERYVVYPILKWLLENAPSLKERAYLGKYLAKVEIPNDIMGDANVAALYEKYRALLEDFKETHKRKSASIGEERINIAELNEDCETMEKEKEIVAARVESAKRKAGKAGNNALALLKVCAQLRGQQDKRKKIRRKLEGEVASTQQLRHKYERLSQQLNELKERAAHLKPETLLEKAREQAQVANYIAKEKMPRELERKRAELRLYEEVSRSKCTREENLKLTERISQMSEQVSKMMESRVTSNTSDDKTPALYRQQVAMVERRKDAVAEEYATLKEKLREASEQVDRKRAEFSRVTEPSAAMGGNRLNENEFEQYVAKLRTRSILYKRQRHALSTLQAERGVLTRTLEIIRGKGEALGITTWGGREFVEKVRGSTGDNEDDNVEKDVVEGMARLSAAIATRKYALAPLLEDVRPLQQTMQVLRLEHEEKRHSYDQLRVRLESNVSLAEREVKDIRDKLESLRRAKEQTKTALEEAEAARERASRASADNIREKIGTDIAEAERKRKTLQDESDRLGATLEEGSRRKKAWHALAALMKCKMECATKKAQTPALVKTRNNGETLMLL